MSIEICDGCGANIDTDYDDPYCPSCNKPYCDVCQHDSELCAKRMYDARMLAIDYNNQLTGE